MASETLNDIVAKIPELRAEIERLQRLLEALEAFEDNEASGDAVEPRPRTNKAVRATAGNIGKDEFVGMSTTQAVKHYLELSGKGNPQGPRDMAKALVRGGRDTDENKAYANVQSVLKRLKKSGELRQVRRGEWGLSSWYGPQKSPARGKDESENGNGTD